MTNHKNVKNNKHLGGGEECKNSLFKPLIATSLALALGVSVASANACANADGATTPLICYGSSGTANISSALSNVVWNGSNGGGNTNTSFWTLGANSGTTPVNITLQFDSTGNGAGSLSGETYTISQNGAIQSTNTNSPILQLSSTTRGIDMQGKTLTFNFLASDQQSNNDWNASKDTTTPNKRKMVLDLSGTTQENTKNISLKGNILIKAGMGINKDLTTDASSTRPAYRNRVNTNEFEATFGGDMVGNITIDASDIIDNAWMPDLAPGSSLASSKHSGFRDIQTTFTFQQGSLDGEIVGYAGVNTFNFNGNNVGITGKVSAHNGYDWDSQSVGAGASNQYYGAINKINFSGNGTATIGGDVTALEASQNIIKFGSNTQGFINGNIASGYYDFTTVNVNQNNFIVFKGTSGQIGSNSNKVKLTIDNSADLSSKGNEQVRYRFSNNVILFDSSSSNSLYLSELKVKGDADPSGNSGRGTFNLLDFSGSNNTATIDSISVNRGTTIIGANLVKDSSANGFTTQLDANSPLYNDAIFEKLEVSSLKGPKVNTIRIKSNALTEFAKDTHTASGTYTIGGIATARGSSTNYINVQNLNITGEIRATSDATAAQNGGFSGRNYIFANGTSSITGNIISSLTDSPGAMSGYNNLLVLRGTSATLGDNNTAIAIKADNGGGKNHSRYSNNTILLDATTTNLNISEISTTASFAVYDDRAKNFNALSFNNSTNSGNKNITTISSSEGSNIIGKGLVTFDSSAGTLTYDATLFGNSISIQGGFSTAFMADTYTAKGSFTFGAIIANSGGTNYINVENLTITGNINASGGNNYIFANGTSSITGNITSSGQTNKIVLNGATNSITGNFSNNAGTNTIDAGSNALTLGSQSKGITILTNGGANATTSIITTGSLIAYIDSMTAGNHANGTKINTISGGANSDLTISTMSATQNANSYNAISVGANSSILVTGNITSSTGKNKFEFTGDSSTLTLKGGTSQISTLTAFASVSSGDTLTLDTTTNTSVVANVNTLVNGGNLKVIFGGNTNKTTQLTLNTANATALKSVSVRGGTNNTLVLSGTGTTAISEKVIIDASQGIVFGLAGGASLTFSQDLETKASGSTTFNLGGTNTITGTLTNNGTHRFVIRNDATLKYADGLSFSTGNNYIVFDTANKSLSWQNANGESKDIITSEGATTINFSSDNGVLNAGVNTTAGTSLIAIADSKSGTITGNINGTNSVEFGGGTAKLTLQGSSNTLSLVDTTNAGTLSLNSSNASTTTITQLKASNLTANFGGTDKDTKLVIADSDTSNKQITLAGVTLENNSTNNTLDLTSLTSATISNPVSVASTQGLTIALGSTNMTFTQGLSGNTVLSVSGTSSFTTTSNSIEANSLNLVGDGSAKATFKNATTTLSTLNANAKGGNTLALDASSNNVAVTLNNAFNGVLSVELNGSASNSTSLTLNGGAIQSINVANGGNNNKVIFSSGNNILNNAIDSNSVANGKTLSLQVGSGVTLNVRGGIDSSNGGTINMELNNNSKLYLGATSSLNSLTASGAVINIANMEVERPTRATTRNTLTIGKNGNSGESYKGNAEFIIYVGGGQADNIVFNNIEKKDGVKSSATITATGSYYSILNGNHTLVATLNDTGYSSTDGSTDNMEKLQGGEVLIGGSLVKTTLIEESDGNGVVKYYLGKGVDEGAPIQYQEVASSALTVNYDLFLANFNSLNKRMGELRDDANSNGVWARVFGGAMSNDFGAGSKTEYITAQVGYDYTLSVGNDARNHLGIAVAYGTSNTQGNTLSMNGLLGSSGSISLNEVDSHMVEVGIYNTFISDSGWYNDTIFKFDYIMGKFSLSNKTDLFTDTSNFAMVLSDEFGYRYKFGENEKGSWYIDPQLELAFGYFNQSDFNRAMYDATGTTLDTIMRAQQDTILTLRTRVGASLGKKFNTEKGFASLYVGAFYEYDYINGGNASVEGQIGGTVKSLESIESNGRAMLNIGSNIELNKGARLYIDVEKSFGDKQRTFMQFNLGARYSF